MLRVNNISFKGWEGNDRLAGKLNNEKELNNLAKAAKVDKLRTNLSKESKYLPHNDLYTTVATKKINGQFYHGLDCVILDKETSKEQISKTIYESAEKAVSKLYEKLGQLNIDNPPKRNPIIDYIKKICKFFKK